MDTSLIDKKRFGEMIRQINSTFGRCFWPSSTCTNRAIRAHSIQNAHVLDLLCENNHVIMPYAEIDIHTGPSVRFKRIGRNNATTFTGLCDDHDSLLFKTIDTMAFDPNNTEQLFLLAYRAVLRELHSKMKGAIDVQNVYSRGAEQGHFNPEVADQPMLMAIGAMSEAWSFYRYKCSYDSIYNSGDYTLIEHNIEYVDGLLPSIAVSSVYSHIDNMKYLPDRLDPKCTVLNVFPCHSGYFVLFSYIKAHKNIVAPYFERVTSAQQHYKLYLLSKLVLMHCENFVISPTFHKGIPETDHKTILSYFSTNTGVQKVEVEDPALYLFVR